MRGLKRIIKTKRLPRSAAGVLVAFLFLAVPLLSAADAQRVQSTVILSGNGVTSFESVLGPGEVAHNTTVYLPLNVSAQVVAARVNVSGVFYTPMINLSGRGTAARDQEAFGQGQHGGGDYNGDGFGDFAIGADGTQGFVQGRAEVFYGSADGIGRNANWSYSAGINGGGFGFSITHGRYNGDSYDDLVVGESHAAAAGVETVYIFHGSPGGLALAPNETLVMNTTTRFHWGESLQGAVDINNDTYDDLVVGEPNYGAGTTGRIFVVWGGPSGLNVTNVTSFAPSGSTRYGLVLESLGDTDGDGLPEIAVGAPLNNSNSGQLDIFEGSQGSQTFSRIWTKLGNGGEYLGYDLAGGYDLVGDANVDLVVSAPANNTLFGVVYIFTGLGSGIYQQNAATTLLPQTGGQEQFGSGVEVPGDIDGDGSPDLIVGANRANNFDGRLYIYTERNFTAAAARIIDVNSTALSESFGWVVKDAGDLNGDGLPEFGAFLAQGINGTFRPGSVRVYYGSAYPLPEDVSVYVNQSLAWTRAGQLAGNTTTPDFSALLQAYVTAHAAEANSSGMILVPLSFNMSRGGRLNVSNIQVGYTIVRPPPNVAATAPTDGSAVLITWSFQATDGNLFSVYSNKSGAWAIIGNVSFPRTSFNDTNIVAGTTYWYYVTEWDTSVPLQSGPSAIVSATPADIQPPNSPLNFTLLRNTTAHRITAQWSLNLDDTVRYEVWRQEGDLTPSVLVANVTPPASSYVDNGLLEEVNYTYRVRAVDDVGLMSPFTPAITERIPDLTPPATPAGFDGATDPSGTAVVLTWTPNSGDTVSYIVLRSASGGVGTFTEAARPTAPPFTVGGLTRNTTYFFQIVAVDKANLQSPPTATVAVFTVDTLPPDAPIATGASALAAGNAVQVTWTASGDDLAFFRVYTNRTGAWTLAAEVAGAGRLASVTNLTDGVEAYFRVSGVDRGGREGPFSNVVSATPSDTQRPGAPATLSVTPPPEGASLVLVWTSPADSDVAGYNVFMLDPTVSADWDLIGTVTGFTFTAAGLQNGISYRFQVSAFDEVPNEGPPSSFVTGTPNDLVPPSPPAITTASASTNQVNLAIAGTADPNVQVQIWVRGTLQSTESADATGAWTGTARLIAGDNTVWAVAIDPSPIVAAIAKTSENSATVHFTLDTARPLPSATTPANGATDVAADRPIVVTFNEGVRPSSVRLTLRDAAGAEVTGTLVYDAVNRTATFTPGSPLAASATYTATVEATDEAGNPMSPTTVSFRTAAGAGGNGGSTPGFEGPLALAGAALAALALLRRRRA